ncbi:hypothetical protein EUX98_g143 [Antrodiella citrinella]|uniref:Carbohydrate kinase PfkB domain-containing protein n=1 Tax=Antrodiella citrinella TaxID=2447956 RepID=A0A4S4N6F5_9APHY|nr:hypothetical protein EUX98_g143 [Antrodiella citrinella]
MPYPTNLETARSVERIVRENGAIPATIGIIQGRVKIGLEAHELERLADVGNNSSVFKVSRRDISPVIALKKDGGTTCSSTLIFAAIAGIKVFATGGLGGVHRGAESSFYTRRSGFKSPWHLNDPISAATILHAQDQLRMNNGVMFAVPIPEQYEQVGQDIQKAVEIALQEADQQGISRRGKEVTPWLLKRVSELTAGKSLPSNIALIENTARFGAQIASEYARLAHGTVGSETQQSLPPATFNTTKDASRTTQSFQPRPASTKLVVVGASAVDITAQASKATPFTTHSTVPGAVHMSLGGVGRNMAEAAHRTLTASSEPYTHETVLVSAVGQDSFGRLLTEESKQIGMRTDGFLATPGSRTAVCNMSIDEDGGLIGGVADMDIIQSLETTAVLESLTRYNPVLVALDGNLSEDTLTSVVAFCNNRNTPVFFEPTSVAKSVRILPAVSTSKITRPPIAFASPNLLELAHMYNAAGSDPLELTQRTSWWEAIDSMNLGSNFRLELEQLSRRNASDHDPSRGTLSFLLERGIAQMGIHLLPFIQHLMIKCGDLGVVVIFRVTAPSAWSNEQTNIHARQVLVKGQTGGHLVLKHFPAIPLKVEDVVNVTGAGDSLVGSMLSSLLQNPSAFKDPLTLSQLVAHGQEAAVKTLQSSLAVSPLLSHAAVTL